MCTSKLIGQPHPSLQFHLNLKLFPRHSKTKKRVLKSQKVLVVNLDDKKKKGNYVASGKKTRTEERRDEQPKQQRTYSTETVIYNTLCKDYQLLTGEGGSIHVCIDRGELSHEWKEKFKTLISKAVQELNFLKRMSQLATKCFIDYILNNEPESIGDLHRILNGTKGHAGEQYWRSIITILRKKKSSTGSKIPIVLKFVEFVSKEGSDILDLINSHCDSTLTLTGPISTLGEELDTEFANQVKGKLVLLAAKVLEFDTTLKDDIKTISCLC